MMVREPPPLRIRPHKQFASSAQKHAGPSRTCTTSARVPSGARANTRSLTAARIVSSRNNVLLNRCSTQGPSGAAKPPLKLSGPGCLRRSIDSRRQFRACGHSCAHNWPVEIRGDARGALSRALTIGSDALFVDCKTRDGRPREALQIHRPRTGGHTRERINRRGLLRSRGGGIRRDYGGEEGGGILGLQAR